MPSARVHAALKRFDAQIAALGDAFSASKVAGVPWQIFASATTMRPQTTPNPDTASDDIANNTALADAVDAFIAAFLPTSTFFRQTVAMAQRSVPWNRDGWDGFKILLQEVLVLFENVTNNAIILGGDLHDS